MKQIGIVGLFLLTYVLIGLGISLYTQYGTWLSEDRCDARWGHLVADSRYRAGTCELLISGIWYPSSVYQLVP